MSVRICHSRNPLAGIHCYSQVDFGLKTAEMTRNMDIFGQTPIKDTTEAFLRDNSFTRIFHGGMEQKRNTLNVYFVA
jgi:hypothetical protein